MPTDPIYYQANREFILNRQKAYYHEKQANNPEYKAKRNEYMKVYLVEYMKAKRRYNAEAKLLRMLLNTIEERSEHTAHQK